MIKYLQRLIDCKARLYSAAHDCVKRRYACNAVYEIRLVCELFNYKNHQWFSLNLSI